MYRFECSHELVSLIVGNYWQIMTNVSGGDNAFIGEIDGNNEHLGTRTYARMGTTAN